MNKPSLRRRALRYAALAAVAVIALLAVGFAGLVYGWARVARTLPDLSGWHTHSPPSEFRARDATAQYTFADYLAQEEKVFAELEDFVDKRWAGERTGGYCRYKADSICNPRTLFDRNWNRTFVLESAAPVAGALLVHGLSDSPYSLRTLGERLHRAGYTVIGLRVPGHGTCPKALADVSYEDWEAAVRVAMQGLRDRIPASAPLVMVGYSNGGALCVNYCAEAIESGRGPVASSLVLISPMIGISPLAEFTELFPAVSAISGEEKLAWSSIDPEIDPFKYSSWPTNGSLQAYRMTRKVERDIAALAADGRLADFPPLIALQSAVDSTVIAHRLIAELMVRLPENGSELVLFDVDRDEILEGLVNNGFEEHIRPLLTRPDLPFGLTLITNAGPDSKSLVARTRAGAEVVQHEIGADWPPGVFSLSHVALPIPPGDPVYGVPTGGAEPKLPLGILSLRGESGVLTLSPAILLRMRYNPFYHWTEDRIMSWLEAKTAR